MDCFLILFMVAIFMNLCYCANKKNSFASISLIIIVIVTAILFYHTYFSKLVYYQNIRENYPTDPFSYLQIMYYDICGNDCSKYKKDVFGVYKSWLDGKNALVEKYGIPIIIGYKIVHDKNQKEARGNLASELRISPDIKNFPLVKATIKDKIVQRLFAQDIKSENLDKLFMRMVNKHPLKKIFCETYKTK